MCRMGEDGEGMMKKGVKKVTQKVVKNDQKMVFFVHIKKCVIFGVPQKSGKNDQKWGHFEHPYFGGTIRWGDKHVIMGYI